MNKDHRSIVVALTLIAVAGLGAMWVTSGDAAAPAGGGGGGGGASASPAQVRIRQAKGQKDAALLRLAQAKAERTAAANRVRQAEREVGGVDFQHHQVRERARFAMAGSAFALVSGNWKGALSGAAQGAFAAHQDGQRVEHGRPQSELNLENANLALENAERAVGLAEIDVLAAENQLALLLAQVTP